MKRASETLTFSAERRSFAGLGFPVRILIEHLESA